MRSTSCSSTTATRGSGCRPADTSSRASTRCATVERELREELGFVAEHAIDAPLMVTCSTTVGVSAGHTDVSLWYVVRRDRDRALDVDEGEFRAARWFPFADVPLERSDPNLGRFLAKLQSA